MNINTQKPAFGACKAIVAPPRIMTRAENIIEDNAGIVLNTGEGGICSQRLMTEDITDVYEHGLRNDFLNQFAEKGMRIMLLFTGKEHGNVTSVESGWTSPEGWINHIEQPVIEITKDNYGEQTKKIVDLINSGE